MKKTVIALATSSIISLSAFWALPCYATIAPQVLNASGSLAPMLQKAMPAIVNITVVGEIEPDALPMLAQPPGGGEATGQPLIPHKFMSLGSGVIVNAEKGYILTNAHVVDKGKSITVALNDGRHFPAKLIGEDKPSDVAVLQIKASKLTALPLGNSNELKVGDPVIAIGNPYDLHQTVTSGIVSALERDDLQIEGLEGYENFIQTDAPINPGNSGGALVNIKGQLVGINTAILAPDGGNVGIGFAIPVDMANSIMEQLIKYGKMQRGLLGILVQPMTPELADAFGLKSASGVVITQISPGTPAASSGLKPGDLLLAINDTPVKSAYQVRNLVGVQRVGNKINLRVSQNGKEKIISLVLANPDSVNNIVQASSPLLAGLDLRDFYQQTSDHGLVRGVQVMYASEDSPGWRTGLRPRDIIVEVITQGKADEIHNIDELSQAARDALQHGDKQLLLRVLRGPGAFYIPIRDEEG